MTYEERMAKAQEKMDTLKAKMANIGEKAKAARTSTKEDIAEVIDAINEDIDALDKAIADDYDAFDNEIDAMIDDQMDTIEGDVEAAKENARLSKEKRDSKINSLKLKAQMKSEAKKEKIAKKREEKDKVAQEMYILDLLEYAESCEQVAFAAAIEADLALLEAAEAAQDYIDKYGEIVLPDEAADEEAAPAEEAPAEE